MTELITYRGRAISSEDILFIRELIAAHPGESRRTPYGPKTRSI